MGFFSWLWSRKKQIIKIKSANADMVLPTLATENEPETPTANLNGDSPQTEAFWDDITRTDITPPNLSEQLGDLNELLSQHSAESSSTTEPAPQKRSKSEKSSDIAPAIPDDKASGFDAIAAKNDLSTTDKLTNLTDGELMQRLRQRSKEGVQTQEELPAEDQEIVANLEKQRAFARVVTQNHLVSENDLNDFFAEYGKRIRSEFIGALMVEARLITESRMNYLLSRNFKIMSVDLQLYEILPSVLDKLDRDVVCEETVIPVDVVGNVLTLASSNPFHIKQIKRLESITQKTVRPVYCKQAQLMEYIEMYYPAGAATVHLEDMGVPEGEEGQALQPEDIDKLSASIQAPEKKKTPPPQMHDDVYSSNKAEEPEAEPIATPPSPPPTKRVKIVTAPAITDSTLKRRQSMRTSSLSRRWSNSFQTESAIAATKVPQNEFEALFGCGEFPTPISQDDTDSHS